MKSIIALQRNFFNTPIVIYTNKEFVVSLFRYNSGIEGLELKNSRGRMVVLPFMGQIIWDLEFDQVNMKMKSMFSEPKKAVCIIDSYGCFAYHSGLIRNGCPSSKDDHILHGEMPCAEMDEAWLELTEDSIKITGSIKYLKGFGHCYLAKPSATIFAGQSYIEICMNVKNLSGTEMPLQYMCHTNYPYSANAKMTQNIPDTAFVIRETTPKHVKPTQQWLRLVKELTLCKKPINILDRPETYNPEIVFFADRIDKYQKTAKFEMTTSDGITMFAEFTTAHFNHISRWILYSTDQQVAAFVLPATCRPEGFLAAKKAGSLITLAPQEEKNFRVITGKK